MRLPHVTLELNNAGRAFICCVEFDEDDIDVRAFVLSHSDEHTHPDIMARRFRDMVRLMDGNVTHENLTDLEVHV